MPTCEELSRNCKGCQYHFRNYEGGLSGCDYYLSTGQRRGCPADHCTRKVIGRKSPSCRQ
jgi:hypothetical protein